MRAASSRCHLLGSTWLFPIEIPLFLYISPFFGSMHFYGVGDSQSMVIYMWILVLFISFPYCLPPPKDHDDRSIVRKIAFID